MNNNLTAAALLLLQENGFTPAQLLAALHNHGGEPDQLLSLCPAEQHNYKNRLESVQRWSDEGIRVLPFGSPHYPQLLARLSTPPPLLWLRGRLPDYDTVGIVGTRTPSQSGMQFAALVTSGAVKTGCATVSGLALGIDDTVHRVTLQNNGTTVAVTAHGLQRLYPAEQSKLADEIIAGGGALVSIWSPQTPPARWRFPARDRIQAALSKCSIIGETGPQGGALYHAKAAAALGNPLGAYVPESNNSKASEGFALLTKKLPAIPLRDEAAALSFIHNPELFTPGSSQSGLFGPSL